MRQFQHQHLFRALFCMSLLINTSSSMDEGEEGLLRGAPRITPHKQELEIEKSRGRDSRRTSRAYTKKEKNKIRNRVREETRHRLCAPQPESNETKFIKVNFESKRAKNDFSTVMEGHYRDKLQDLIQSIATKTIYEKGLGKPEPLQGKLVGFFSRRIAKKHRLVYRLVEGELYIHSCHNHYDD